MTADEAARDDRHDPDPSTAADGGFAGGRSLSGGGGANLDPEPTPSPGGGALAADAGGGRTVWYVLAAHGELVATKAAAPADEAMAEAMDEVAKPAKGDVGCGIVVAILGLLCLIVPVSQVLSSAPEVRLRWLGWVGLFGGVSLTAVGVWYGVDAFTQERRSRREHLQRTFYAMVEAHNGEFSLLQYAKTADISGQQARAYLDERAQEFNATFEVDMDGGIIYRFR